MMKAQPLTIGRLRKLLKAWADEYGDECEVGLRDGVSLYAGDNANLTTDAPDYDEEIEAWGGLEDARQQPEFRANFPLANYY